MSVSSRNQLIMLDGHQQSGLLTLFLCCQPQTQTPTESAHYWEQWKRREKKTQAGKVLLLVLSCPLTSSWNFRFCWWGGSWLSSPPLPLTTVRPFMFFLSILGHCQRDWERVWGKFKCGSAKAGREYWVAGFLLGKYRICVLITGVQHSLWCFWKTCEYFCICMFTP